MPAFVKTKEDEKVNPGGRAEEAGVTEKDFPKATIDKGIKVELEHTKDRTLAKKIVLDHLAEFPDYYEALDKMEEGLKKAAVRVASRWRSQRLTQRWLARWRSQV